MRSSASRRGKRPAGSQPPLMRLFSIVSPEFLQPRLGTCSGEALHPSSRGEEGFAGGNRYTVPEITRNYTRN